MIFLLIFISIYYHHQTLSFKKTKYQQGLLSQRIYTEILEPQSLLITNFAPFEKELRASLEKQQLNVSVYIENLRGGASMSVHGKTKFPPLSLNKLPLAILILRKVELGQLTFDTPIPINPDDKSAYYGSLYKTNATALPLKELVEIMLQDSDNTAMGALLRSVTADDLNFMLSYYGLDPNLYYPFLTVSRGEIRPEVTSKTMSNVFKSLYLSTVLEPEHSEYLLSLLTKTIFDLNKFADLPKEVVVAHKFGINYVNDNEMFHDCGIIYIKESRFFYCIMIEGLEREQALTVVGDIVTSFYKYVVHSRDFLDTTYRNDTSTS